MNFKDEKKKKNDAPKVYGNIHGRAGIIMLNAERDYSILGQRKNAYCGLFSYRGHNNFPFEDFE